MENKKESKLIEASPTKELFIYMLIRDIPLIRSIIDLVDNSVDGAIRGSENSDFTDYWVRIEVGKDKFRIIDNCGGISVDVARNYAFRFGRPIGAIQTPNSIGQFGVGMKRTFFKLGSVFNVSSTTLDSNFKINIDVETWKNDEGWHFYFEELNENQPGINSTDIGTKIEITNLHESVSKNFSLENFLSELKQEIRAAHSVAIDKGLSITFNGVPVESKYISLLDSDVIKPVNKKITFDETSDAPLNIRLFAGVAEQRSLEDGGWYVFCNGRMVLEADQTIITGWGETGGKSIPKYHPDFAFFRGYVFFDCDDAEKLPWTTTKTGVDADSVTYHAARLEMINVMKPVLGFLRVLAREKSNAEMNGDDNLELQKTLENASPTKYSALKASDIFIAPQKAATTRPASPPKGRILYYKEKDKISKVKKVLHVSTAREIGEKTFDYFYQMECDE